MCLHVRNPVLAISLFFSSTLASPAVKSQDGEEDVSSHCSEVEDELDPDFEVTEDRDDLEETSGGRSVLNTVTDLRCSGERNWAHDKYNLITNINWEAVIAF